MTHLGYKLAVLDLCGRTKAHPGQALHLMHRMNPMSHRANPQSYILKTVHQCRIGLMAVHDHGAQHEHGVLAKHHSTLVQS